jgi:hypothetical protein
MAAWPVYVDGWQLECCGQAFAVGDQVEWTLMFSTDERLPRALVVDFAAEVEGAANDGDHFGYIVRAGGVSAWVDEANVMDGRVTGRGLLCEEHHGGVPESVPPTGGRVERIQMVTRPFARTGATAWTPTTEEVALRDVLRSPGAFNDEETLPDRRQIQTGVLVLLVVEDDPVEQ